MKQKHIIYLFFTLLFMTSCNNEDNINEIFMSGTWNVGNFYNGGNWSKYDNDGAKVKYTKEEDIKALNALTIIFLDDGTIQGNITTGTFSGKWSAQPDGRTVSITELKTNGTLTGKSKEFIEALKNAAYYKGDSNYLKLAPEDKKSYVQLGHYPK